MDDPQLEVLQAVIGSIAVSVMDALPSL